MLSENNVLLSLRKKLDCFQIMATLSQPKLSQFYSCLTKGKKIQFKPCRQFFVCASRKMNGFKN
jgi:hypothetical protein